MVKGSLSFLRLSRTMVSTCAMVFNFRIDFVTEIDEFKTILNIPIVTSFLADGSWVIFTSCCHVGYHIDSHLRLGEDCHQSMHRSLSYASPV